jgi:hypothetical protein
MIVYYEKCMPRRELRNPQQIHDWLLELSQRLTVPGEMILIGSGGLLWHAFQNQVQEPLPENSMDVDPVTDSEEIARICYEALIGSEFEQKHGWHINLMPDTVLKEFPVDWKSRASRRVYGHLTVTVPSPEDLLKPKLKRNEPRDRAHEAWARRVKLIH